MIEILARPTDPGASLASGSTAGVLVRQPVGRPRLPPRLGRPVRPGRHPSGAVPHRAGLAPGRLCRGGELVPAVRLVRHDGFDEAVDFQADWLPPGLAGESAVTISPGQTEAKFAIHADTRARPGRYRIAMNATTTGGFVYTGVGRTRVSSSFVDLTVSEPYLTIAMHRSAIERGGRGEIVCDINSPQALPRPDLGLVEAPAQRREPGGALRPGSRPATGRSGSRSRRRPRPSSASTRASSARSRSKRTARPSASRPGPASSGSTPDAGASDAKP